MDILKWYLNHQDKEISDISKRIVAAEMRRRKKGTEVVSDAMIEKLKRNF